MFVHRVALIRQPIQERELLDFVQTPRAGAAVLFLGTTREWTGEQQTLRLEYEAHEPLAVAELERLCIQAGSEFGLLAVAVVHRLGTVPLGQASVAVAVSSAHRQPAFNAAAWLMDRIKESVPIWKQEHWANGEREWVHPNSAGALSPPSYDSARLEEQPPAVPAEQRLDPTGKAR